MIGQGLSYGTLIDDKYTIEGLLGKGGMGAVYRALHVGTKRTVAIKIIHPQFSKNEEFVERFRREAQAAGRLRHPNVVDVTDFGFAQTTSGRIAYLVMEYLDGCTLAQVLAEEGRLPREWVVDILEQVCSAVDSAHQSNIIHRDLKPENIWLEPNRRGGYTIKVLDFGLVKLGQVRSAESYPPPQNSNPSFTSDRSTTTKDQLFDEPSRNPQTESAASLASTLVQSPGSEESATLIRSDEDSVERRSGLISPGPSARLTGGARAGIDSDKNPLTAAVRATLTEEAAGLTRIGSVMGTPLYMSPEQCRGEALDARSDIYSLGVVAYRMLTGEMPFNGDMEELIRLHTTANPPPIREKNRRVPRRMVRVVMSALAKSPDDRPETASGFASALREGAESSGALLRHAISLYSERFPAFFKVALLSYLPVIALVAVLNLDVGIIPWERLDPLMLMVVAFSLIFAMISANLLAYSTVAATVAPIVVQSMIAPLRPVRIRTAFATLARRWRVFALTTIAVITMVLVGSLLFVVPGVVAAVVYALYAPIVVIEGTGVRATLRRARRLIKRSWSTALVITVLQLALPVLVWYASVGLKMNLKLEGFSPREFSFNLSFSAGSSLFQLLNILVAPLTAIMTALLYLKTRHAGGESLKDAIDQFDALEIPRSQWQAQMRSRFAIARSTASTREANRGSTT